MFAGCGGSSIGWRDAGFVERLAVEWDDEAADHLTANFPGLTVHRGDVTLLSSAEFMDKAGVRPGELHALDASPPCQGFSLCGNRRDDDPRNQLYTHVAKLLRDVRPMCFGMENVPGLVKGAMGEHYLRMLEAYRDAGYDARGEVLRATSYGVAQIRERVIIVGVRRDLGVAPEFPAPQTKVPTVRQAWRDLGRNDVDGPEPTDKFVRYWHEAGPGQVMGGFGGTFRLSWMKPSPTLQRVHGYGGAFHPDAPRTITTAERCRIAGFPDWYKFESWRACSRLLGNAVPPPLMCAVATTLRLTVPGLA